MPQLFEEDEVEVAVPHTEYAQQCSDCFGRGRVQCKHCKGPRLATSARGATDAGRRPPRR